MNIFGTPNIERMAAEGDHDGLYKCLEHRNKLVRLQAAQALAEMGDGVGWRFLIDSLMRSGDMDTQAIAASMLGELGHPRAVPFLADTLEKSRRNPLLEEITQALREALEAIGGPDAEAALRKAGFLTEEAQTPSGEDQTEAAAEDTFVRPILPRTDEIRFLSAEEHLNNAVDLREAELAERGLVQAALALWLSPGWAYAWYLRGVLFDDLDRQREAAFAYQRAVELDPLQKDASEALADLEEEPLAKDLDPHDLLSELTRRDWRARRDAAAGIGELSRRQPASSAMRSYTRRMVDALIDCLADEEREVRHAAIEALGQLGDRRAVLPLLGMEESSWLVRFTLLQALSQLRSTDGLITALRKEMERLSSRNPVFTSHKDPLLDVEYDQLMEIGVLAFERTGETESLLAVAEANTWEVIETEDDEESANGFPRLDKATSFGDDDLFSDFIEGEDMGEVDEDLSSYVDEVARLVLVALERLAAPRLAELSTPLLERLARVPDLTLADPADPQEDPLVVYDLSELRKAASEKLKGRPAHHV